MGRTEKSQGLAPPAIRKDIRAKQARHIINKVVPAILASNARARRGADSSELIVDPGPATSSNTSKIDASGEDTTYVKRKGQGRRKAKGVAQEVAADDEETAPPKGKTKKGGKRRNDSINDDLSALTLAPTPAVTPRKPLSIKVLKTDSLTAAHLLSFTTTTTSSKPGKKNPNVCVLNMASPLRPGGGVLAGATSQEEFLCARTTLLPSLKESYYRLPEYGAIYSPDVLVFRGPGPLGDSAGDLGPAERYWVDVVSAGMLRFPDLEGGEDEVKRLGRREREIAERKMRAVLRVVEAKGARRLVLGAWGCGAYGNPVGDVAEAWRRVLIGVEERGAKKGRVGQGEVWSGLEEVVFAITSPRMAEEFARAFGGGVEVESGPGRVADDDEEEEEEDQDDRAVRELRSKIEEMEGQISKVWNPELKLRLGVVLDGLKAQLKEREGGKRRSEGDGSDGASVENSEDDEQGDELADDGSLVSTDDESNDFDTGVAVKP